MCLGYGSATRFFEHGNDFSGSVKGTVFFYHRSSVRDCVCVCVARFSVRSLFVFDFYTALL
jgi:hypothetical protein